MYAMSAWRLGQGLGASLVQAGRKADFQAVGTDSRKLAKGSCFVALQGQRPGESFFEAAIQQGAAGLVGRRFNPRQKAQARRHGAWLWQVKDGLVALQALALDQRRFFHGPVIAVTGSNGKTGTKDLLASLLGMNGPVLATQGNLNNHIGVPLTLLAARSEQWAWVLEAGMNHRGELLQLGRLIRPDLALELNVGDAHLGHFKGRAAVAAAKAELLQGLAPAGTAVLNGDDPYTRAMGQGLDRKVTFGLGVDCDLRLTVHQDRGAAGFSGEARWKRSWTQKIKGQQGGKAALSQAAAALATGAVLGLEPRALAKALAGYRPKAAMRQELKPLPQGSKALLDAYNASPQSMAAALGYLKLSAPQAPRWAVLGCMLELGAQSADLHRALGVEAKKAGLQGLVVLGEHSREVSQGFGPGAVALEKDQVSEAADWVRERLKPGAWFLFKGSRGLAVERVYQASLGA